eukprot:scpid91610/ scgid30030/ 
MLCSKRGVMYSFVQCFGHELTSTTEPIDTAASQPIHFICRLAARSRNEVILFLLTLSRARERGSLASWWLRAPHPVATASPRQANSTVASSLPGIATHNDDRVGSQNTDSVVVCK